MASSSNVEGLSEDIQLFKSLTFQNGQNDEKLVSLRSHIDICTAGKWKKKRFIQNGKTLLPAAAQLSFDEDVKVKKRSLHKE